jgi:hypothetical protein
MGQRLERGIHEEDSVCCRSLVSHTRSDVDVA